MKPNFILTMQATLIKPDLIKLCHSTKHFFIIAVQDIIVQNCSEKLKNIISQDELKTCIRQ